jgi:hypothetical protein
MATTYRIHPAIGIARVGNSPAEFFIGPERPGELPEPPGGFKDADCRVKRQAARFRIFAHHDDGTVEPVTAAQADIAWSVHLVNRKAAFPGRTNTEPAADLTIDPGSRSLSTPNGLAAFDGGTITFTGQSAVSVPLGEMRTDDDGNLLVLGGAGHSASPAGNGIDYFWDSDGWYDDVSDGPVTATITLTGTGTSPPVEGAWVLVTPPKFAPHQDSITTLYDRLEQRMIDLGLLPAPTTTSYTQHVYPILQRARDMAWVEGAVSNHQWVHPITNQAAIDGLFARIGNPAGGGGNMPQLNGSDHLLTPTQYAHLQRWQAGAYTNDWAGVPVPDADITPAGMDRAALEACVGGAFYPGIEAGGLSAGSRPILEKPYAAPFRLDHTQCAPGDISAAMALPWQADFWACGDNWWPVPRPNDVLATSGGSTIRWSRDVASMDEMVNEWSNLGFVVKQGSEHLEVQHCAEKSIALLTPHLNFLDVPQGPMGMVREAPLAITFEVASPGAAVTLEYAAGGAPNHPQLVPTNTSVTVGPTAGNVVATASLWIIFRTDAVGSSIATQTVTVQEAGTGRTWTITIDGNTVARATTATALALDRSGSMSALSGGVTKHVALQQAANMFVDLMLEGDGVGIARFSTDAQALQPVLTLGNGQLSDLNRSATHDIINGSGLNPAGATSIGDGIYEARGLLDVSSGYDRKALVVLTDGIENQPRWIADVSAQIDATTYAIGFGMPQDISVQALQTISGNTGGYLLVTGDTTGDNRFRLQKHFLQVLSGVNNSEVVLDPDGTLTPGQVVRIPFTVSDADSGLEVVLMTPLPHNVDFRLETPNGMLVEPWQAQADPAMQFAFSDQSAFYRLALPLQLQPNRFDQAGKWHAVLTIGKPRVGGDFVDVDREILDARRNSTTPPQAALPSEAQRRFELARLPQYGASATHGGARQLPFSLVVQAYSSVSFRASAEQSGYRVGSEAHLSAVLTQSGLPIDDAAVWAEITAPSGRTTNVDLAADGARWIGSFPANEAGVHRARVRARGRTRKAVRFEREQTVTVVVWHGADRPGDPASTPRPDPVDGGDADLCDFLSCVLGPDGAISERLRARLDKAGFDLGRLWKCLAKCHDRRDRTPDALQ